ncbi:MAG: hypothetical protein AAFZ49_19765, partial [Cyanobacteria bacterium J06659_2]
MVQLGIYLGAALGAGMLAGGAAIAISERFPVSIPGLSQASATPLNGALDTILAVAPSSSSLSGRFADNSLTAQSFSASEFNTSRSGNRDRPQTEPADQSVCIPPTLLRT